MGEGLNKHILDLKMNVHSVINLVLHYHWQHMIVLGRRLLHAKQINEKL